MKLWSLHAKLSGHFRARMIGSKTPYYFENRSLYHARCARVYAFFLGCV